LNTRKKLHELGQSLWLDHITRDLLNKDVLMHLIEEWSITGLTFKPALFRDAIKNSVVYDAAIRKKLKESKSGEELFLEIALEDLGHAADLLRPIFDQTDGAHGWVSLEVSPRLTQDTDSAVNAVKDLYGRARRPNLFIKIPGTREGLPAVEKAIFAGVPINVTLLFSCEHYLAAAEAYLRGIERRIAAGLKPNVWSVASLHVGCWDVAVKGRVPDVLHNQLGIAMAKRTYKACRELLRSPRWESARNAGARPQRLMWVGTETRDPETSDVLYGALCQRDRRVFSPLRRQNVGIDGCLNGGMTMKNRNFGFVLALVLLALSMGHSTSLASDDATSIMCDNGVVQTGDFFQTVQDKCGEPDKKEGKFWRYNLGPSEPVYTVEFDENGKVVRIVEDQGGS